METPRAFLFMTKPITFQFSQTIDTLCPGLFIVITYEVTAIIYENEEVWISSARANIANTFWQDVTLPNGRSMSSDERKMMGVFRENARVAAFQLKKNQESVNFVTE